MCLSLINSIRNYGMLDVLPLVINSKSTDVDSIITEIKKELNLKCETVDAHNLTTQMIALIKKHIKITTNDIPLRYADCCILCNFSSICQRPLTVEEVFRILLRHYKCIIIVGLGAPYNFMHNHKALFTYSDEYTEGEKT